MLILKMLFSDAIFQKAVPWQRAWGQSGSSYCIKFKVCWVREKEQKEKPCSYIKLQLQFCETLTTPLMNSKKWKKWPNSCNFARSPLILRFSGPVRQAAYRPYFSACRKFRTLVLFDFPMALSVIAILKFEPTPNQLQVFSSNLVSKWESTERKL